MRTPQRMQFSEIGRPSNGLNDAPVALRRSLTSDLSLAEVGLQYAVSSFDPRLYIIFREEGGTVGVFARHIHDISGCGETGVLEQTTKFPETRFGERKLQESAFVHVGMESY